MNFRIFSAFLIMVLVGACASDRAARFHEYQGIRIGLIADTQHTTDKLKEDYRYRSRQADKMSNVSIRAPAIEAIALANMEYMAKDLAEKEADVLLYLGDGANSGCADEIGEFFEALEEVRQSSEVPVFFVVGNHDYLATGNLSRPLDRRNTCGGHEYISKAVLVEKVSKFNQVSFEHFNKDGFLTAYVDSWIDVNAMKQRCGDGANGDAHIEGCFYSAIIGFTTREGKIGEVLLLDTSDYRDLVQLPSVSRKDELFGIRGGISFDDRNSQSQVGWFLEKGRADDTDLRILASHYPSKDLKWWARFAPAGRTGSLMLENGQNLWVSGHTHTDEPEDAYARSLRYVGGELTSPRYYSEINVGSTTDYPPHVTLVTDTDGVPEKIDYFLEGYGTDTCEAVYTAVEQSNSSRSAFGTTTGQAALGMTTDYRDDDYLYADTEFARNNLKDFIAEFSQGDLGKRKKAVQCVLLRAAKNEKSLFSWF